jgi:flagellin
MSLSIQTNVASLEAQNSIRINNNFQNNTIQQLSSGFRINQSGDDAAGLATANQYAGTIATLSQGVLNANNSISTLQIADGGISNISTILNRLQTLATESASSTFAGNRTTVNDEYQGLLTEVNRQAASINLNTGGLNNANLTTYVGGGDNQADSQVTVNLSSPTNAVDSTALGIQATTVAGGGTELSGGAVINLNNTAVTYLASASTQTYAFNIGTPTGNQAVNAVVTGNAGPTGGLTGAEVVSQLNSTLGAYGISASLAADGGLQFGGSTAFSVTTGAASGGNAAATAGTTAINTGNYNLDSGGVVGGAGAFTNFTGGTEAVTFNTASGSRSVTLTSTNAANIQAAETQLNQTLAGTGVSAISDAAGTSISFQSANAFTATEGAVTAGGGSLFGVATPGNVAVNGPVAAASTTGNAIAALTALSTAISNLGLTQGIVGAGENKLNYAVNLAQSQITNYSAAESGIKDADVAAEAANLTKAQVLQQASLAALAQANSAPQAVLSLLKG